MAVAINRKRRQRLHAFACNLIGQIEEPAEEQMDRIVSGFEATSALPVMQMIREESRLKYEELSAWLRNRMNEGWKVAYPFKMIRSPFTGSSLVDPPTVDLTAITATTVTSMWLVPSFTPIPAAYARSGQTFELIASGIWSTGASGTLTISPFYGTTTGGVALGASPAQTVPVSITTIPWFMHGVLNFRSVNNSAATQSTVKCGGAFMSQGTLATAGTGTVVPFGGTTATVDTTTAGGLCMGWTLSVAGSCTPQIVLWRDT